jgi:hypothetical protein
MLDLAAANLLSPMVLCFGLGLMAALARSDLTVPESIAKGMSIYLLFAIGFKGGVAVAENGIDAGLALAIGVGVALSFSLPLIAFGLLRRMSGMSVLDAAAVSAHYGSISIVTFVAATSVADAAGLRPEGYMVAVAAAMEAPAILSALWLVARNGQGRAMEPDLLREILLNGSIVLLVGSFVIGWATGPQGLTEISAFITAPFKGVLCLFLLDMGLVAGRGLLGGGRVLDRGAIAFALIMPLIGGILGAFAGTAVGLSTGGVMLMATLAASASYIAVPAAMRVALPEANPSVYLTLSLGVTFPFNLTIGLPAYLWLAQTLTKG